PEPEPASEAPVLFRPGKKRKIYRHRPEEAEAGTTIPDDVESATTSSAVATSSTAGFPTTDAAANDEGLSVTDALRIRNARKHRHGGVAFRAGPSHGDDGAYDENTEQGLVPHHGAEAAQQEESVILGGISRRFAPQTGLVGELVNKHMEEYVESELARRKRYAAEALAQQQSEENAARAAGDPHVELGEYTAPVRQVDPQRVLQGKLMEIDLGDEARARNIEMTERARRRLQGLAADEEEETGARRKKVRLGPDGKPWRSRNRRGSDDIKRDQLVEKFLSENSLGVYDVQPEQPATVAGLNNEEMAADDRIAEEFRREFMDAMSQRRRKKTAVPAKPGVKKEEEVLKGPKLGGSRNARAAMRDLLLKEQEKKKR
ncbi:hepatocellular carcinoma-associated antigen 59-domain-containing protein, partial [Lasiosphaeris hirsuta]